MGAVLTFDSRAFLSRFTSADLFFFFGLFRLCRCCVCVSVCLQIAHIQAFHSSQSHKVLEQGVRS